ncbi:MAG: UvrD-helicase domain-containing protein [Comamonadaceae bacterium]|nr:UvrD-helicase domain-containing protein [Comamonadaceae bacterium]
MAVPAVPGAGKTTIMQALIIELIKKGFRPSEILVLTYMESAARMFQDRIKRNCPDLTEMPYISTIHGLAYKIIQDENNFVKLGLNSDFQLCDDSDRFKILQDVCSRHLPFGEDDLNKWMELNSKAISRAKQGDLNWKDIDLYLKNNSNQHLEEFLPVYKGYLQALKDKNMIDFDDLLVMATKLLRNYPGNTQILPKNNLDLS